MDCAFFVDRTWTISTGSSVSEDEGYIYRLPYGVLLRRGCVVSLRVECARDVANATCLFLTRHMLAVDDGICSRRELPRASDSEVANGGSVGTVVSYRSAVGEYLLCRIVSLIV